MPTTRRAQVIARTAALLAVGLSASAWTSGTSVPLPVATGTLLTVETRGGLCVDGPCGTTIVIERNGRVHQAAKPPNYIGIVPQPASRVSVDLARPEGAGRALATYEIRIEGRDEWVAAAERWA